MMPREGAGPLLRQSAETLERAGCDTPGLDARLLLQFVSGLTHADIVSSPERELSEEHSARFQKLLKRRANGEPVSRLVGMREFYGREFVISPDVLDPRPDTEILIDAAAAILKRSQTASFLDMGAGSGAIAVTLLCECADATGVATDVSEAALDIAGQNAERLGVRDRLKLVRTSWAEGISGEFDLVVSNPPYIASNDIAGLSREVREHDPKLALDGGPDGLDCYRQLFAQAPGVLSPDGRVIVEFGAGQDGEVVKIANAAGLQVDKDAGGLLRDLAGHIRCCVFERS